MTDDELRGLLEANAAEIRQRFEMTTAEIRRLETELGRRIDTTNAEMRQRFETTNAEMRQRFETTNAEMRQRFETTNAETRQRFEITNAETQRRFDTLQSGFEGLHRHFDVVSERFDSKIDLLVEGLMNLDEKVVREIGSVREEMRQGFTDTHDLIRFSHRNLDRRVSALERRKR